MAAHNRILVMAAAFCLAAPVFAGGSTDLADAVEKMDRARIRTLSGKWMSMRRRAMA